jgi:integrase
LPPRIDSPLLFPGHRGKPIDLHNFSNREWRPAVEASGIETPARLYDLRCTFASNALAVGVTPCELARIMGTSIAMIERSYGALLGGASDSIADRLDQIERLGQDRATAEGEG